MGISGSKGISSGAGRVSNSININGLTGNLLVTGDGLSVSREGNKLKLNLTDTQQTSLIPFINENTIEVDYVKAFDTKVLVLNRESVVGYQITIISNNVSEVYTNIGMFYIDIENRWSDKSTRMCFTNGNGSFLVFDGSRDSWVLTELNYPDIDDLININKFDLMFNGSLPRSYGDVLIDLGFDNIPLEYFKECEPNKRYFNQTNKLTIDFSGTYQSGYIIL